MARLANAFDLLGEDSFDVRKVVAVVDAKQDAADFLAAEKKKKEEAKEAERKRAEQRQRLKKKKLRDAVVNSVLAFPAYRPSSSSFRRRPSFPQEYNDEQNQGQGVAHAPVKKKWVPKSGENDAALAAASPSPLELEKEKGKETEGCDATVEKKQTKEGVVDGEEKTKEEEGSNNGADGGGSNSKSVDGKSRQNKNGSLRRKLRKQKKAAADGGEKKEAEDTKEGDASSVQNQLTTRSYTLKEYEEMKKRESLKEKKDNDNDSSHQQQPQPQPKKVTIDVNKEFRTPQERQGRSDNGGRRFNNEGRRFNHGGPRYNNGERRFNNEAQRFDNGGQRFNNEGRRFDNGGQRCNNEGRRFDNGGQRSNNEGQRLEFSLNDAEFPTLGRNSIVKSKDLAPGVQKDASRNSCASVVEDTSPVHTTEESRKNVIGRGSHGDANLSHVPRASVPGDEAAPKRSNTRGEVGNGRRRKGGSRKTKSGKSKSSGGHNGEGSRSQMGSK